MRYATLGNTGIKVSRMALGCWPFAGGSVWGPQDDNDSIAAVHASLDAGVNFFDTAEGYSDDANSEEVLGKALVGRRNEAVIATKISDAHLHPSTVAERCEGSLSRMQTDYIDLYQIHWPNHDVPVDEPVALQPDLAGVGIRNQTNLRSQRRRHHLLQPVATRTIDWPIRDGGRCSLGAVEVPSFPQGPGTGDPRRGRMRG